MQSQKFIGTVLESNQEQGWQSYKSQFSIFSGHGPVQYHTSVLHMKVN